MDTIGTADGSRSTCTFLEESESATISARRRRKEIRRFRLIASSRRFAVPDSKRTRSFGRNSFSSRMDEKLSLSGCRPDCGLTRRLSTLSADSEERKSDASASQAFDCPAGRDMTSMLPSPSSPWERSSPGTVMQSSSSGEDSSSSGSGSISSVSSDSSGRSLESNEAVGSSSTTSTSDLSRSALDLAETKLQPEGAQSILTPQDLKVPVDRDRADVGVIVPTTPRSHWSSADHHQCPPHGSVSVCGRRREMEDAVATVPAFLSVPLWDCTRCRCRESNAKIEVDTPLHFFGVYDGHGGSQAALFCADRLHHALAEEMKTVLSVGGSCIESSDNCSTLIWRKAMLSCFLRVDAEIGGLCWRSGQCDKEEGDSKCCTDPIAPETVGSTAVVAVVSSRQIIVANCGDSRAVLSRGGQAIALSEDHKPEREDEMARVEAAGGRVIFWNGYRVLGVLAMSRAIGDRYLKPYVIAEPEVTCTHRSNEDECLILASDGLWDVLSNEMVCDIARKCLSGRRSSDHLLNIHVSGLDDTVEESPAAMAAALLTKLALARGSSDNISVVVVNLMAEHLVL